MASFLDIVIRGNNLAGRVLGSVTKQAKELGQALKFPALGALGKGSIVGGLVIGFRQALQIVTEMKDRIDLSADVRRTVNETIAFSQALRNVKETVSVGIVGAWLGVSKGINYAIERMRGFSSEQAKARVDAMYLANEQERLANAIAKSNRVKSLADRKKALDEKSISAEDKLASRMNELAQVQKNIRGESLEMREREMTLLEEISALESEVAAKQQRAAEAMNKAQADRENEDFERRQEQRRRIENALLNPVVMRQEKNEARERKQREDKLARLQQQAQAKLDERNRAARLLGVDPLTLTGRFKLTKMQELALQAQRMNQQNQALDLLDVSKASQNILAQIEQNTAMQNGLQ